MSSSDNLKKEAKRWLKALRNGDPDARARFARAYPSAAAEPTLRDVQHALAREHGFAGWSALRIAIDRGKSDDEVFVSLLNTAGEGSAARAEWQTEFDGILRRHPNAVRAGYTWGDAIVAAAAHAPGYVVEALVRHGAAVDVAGKSSIVPEDARGLMPLHSAALHGNLDESIAAGKIAAHWLTFAPLLLLAALPAGADAGGMGRARRARPDPRNAARRGASDARLAA